MSVPPVQILQERCYVLIYGRGTFILTHTAFFVKCMLKKDNERKEKDSEAEKMLNLKKRRVAKCKKEYLIAKSRIAKIEALGVYPKDMRINIFEGKSEKDVEDIAKTPVFGAAFRSSLKIYNKLLLLMLRYGRLIQYGKI